MSKDNLELWNKVEKTNPNYTKKAKISGMSITSIAPQYQIKQVTEQFGAYGEAWGFKNIELTYELVESFNMVVFKGTFFFPKGEFEIINSCKLFMDNKQTMVDDNFAKKIETDSLTKAISKLGFNADIFLGKFDDQRYLAEVTKEFATPVVKAKLTPEGLDYLLSDKGTPEQINKALKDRDVTTEQITKLKAALK